MTPKPKLDALIGARTRLLAAADWWTAVAADHHTRRQHLQAFRARRRADRCRARAMALPGPEAGDLAELERLYAIAEAEMAAAPGVDDDTQA